MKTTKTNSESDRVLLPEPSKESKGMALVNFGPDEEEIREKAREIYFQRIELGEEGTPESDWFEAENYLNESQI